MVETWKPVIGYEGFYEVSNLGRIKSLARSKIRNNGRPLVKCERIMKNTITAYGYHSVYLTKDKPKRIPVHRLVAIAFLYNDDKSKEVNHIDGNKTNNRLDNLEWCTKSENLTHAYRIGLKRGLKGAANPFWGKNIGRKGSEHPLYGKVGKLSARSIPVLQIDLDGNLINEFESINLAAKNVNGSSGNIYNVTTGKWKTAYGFVWKRKSFVNENRN